MIRTAVQHNRDTQPTNESALSVCANAAMPACACAKNFYAFLTDAALAVSVFAFFSLIALILGSVGILPAVLAVVVAAYRLYRFDRFYIVRFFTNGYKVKVHSMLTTGQLV